MPLPQLTNAFQVLLSACFFALMVMQLPTLNTVICAVLLVGFGLLSLFAQLVSITNLAWTPWRLLALIAATFVPYLINLDLMVNVLWHAHNGLSPSAAATNHAAAYLAISSACALAFFLTWKRPAATNIATMFDL